MMRDNRLKTILEKVHEIYADINRDGLSEEEKLQTILDAVRVMLPQVNEAMVLLHDYETDDLVGWVAFPKDHPTRVGLRIKRGENSRARRLFDDPERDIDLTNDVNSEEVYMSVSEKTKHELDVQIGQFGVLNLETYEKTRPFDENDVEMARLLAEQARIALYTEEQLSLRRSLAKTQREIAEQSSLSQEKLFEKILIEARELIQAHYGSIFLLDESEHLPASSSESDSHPRRLVRRADNKSESAMPFGEPKDGKIVNLDDANKRGIVGKTVADWLEQLKSSRHDLKPEYVPDVNQRPDFRPYFPETVSELVIPLVARSNGDNEHPSPKLLGVMNFESPRPFTPEHIAIVKEFAQMAVIVINQSEGAYYKNMIRSLHKIDVAIEELITSEDLKEVVSPLFIALDEACNLFGASRAILYTFESHRRRRVIYDTNNLDRKQQREFFPIEGEDETFPRPEEANPIVNYLIRDSHIRRFRLFDWAIDKHLVGEPSSNDVRSAMAVQIRGKANNPEELTGILYVESQERFAFRDVDLRNLSIFAGQMQIAEQLSIKTAGLRRAKIRAAKLTEVASKLNEAKSAEAAREIVLNAAYEVIKEKAKANKEDGLGYAASFRSFNWISGELEITSPNDLMEHNLTIGDSKILIGHGVTGKVVQLELNRLLTNEDDDNNEITIRAYSVDSKEYRQEIDNHVLSYNSKIHSIIAVPIMKKNTNGNIQIYGALTLAATEYYYFSKSDREFLGGLAVMLLGSLGRIESFSEETTMLMGTFAYDLLHPVGNPKSLANANIEQLEYWLQNLRISIPSEIQAVLYRLRNNLEDFEDSIEMLREISSLHKPDAVPPALIEVIDLQHMLEENIKSKFSEVFTNNQIALTCRGDRSSARVRIRSNYFFKAIYNLVQNSCDAMSENGGREIAINISTAPNIIVITLSDDGPGLPEKIKDRMFNRGFTTKPKGKGKGWGLWIAQTYLKLDDAQITGFNKEFPLNGAIFRIIVPTQ